MRLNGCITRTFLGPEVAPLSNDPIWVAGAEIYGPSSPASGGLSSIRGTGAPQPRPAGDGLVLDLPTAPTRSLDAYKITPGDGSAS